jgi:hypothetical protein
MYYGNPSLTAESNINQAFLFYDNGGNLSSWNVVSQRNFIYQDNAFGSPAPSYAFRCDNQTLYQNYMYRNTNVDLINTLIIFHLYLRSDHQPVFAFLCDQNGYGNCIGITPVSNNPAWYYLGHLDSWSSGVVRNTSSPSGWGVLEDYWFRFLIFIDGQNSMIKVYRDDFYSASSLPINPSFSGNLVISNSLSRIGGSYIGITNSIHSARVGSYYWFYDNILIRRYVNPEPEVVVYGERSITETPFVIDYNGFFGFRTMYPTSVVHIYSSDGFNQLRLQQPFTPTSSDDVRGQAGNIAWDDNYLYVKTNEGWKRVDLFTF